MFYFIEDIKTDKKSLLGKTERENYNVIVIIIILKSFRILCFKRKKINSTSFMYTQQMIQETLSCEQQEIKNNNNNNNHYAHTKEPEKHESCDFLHISIV